MTHHSLTVSHHVARITLHNPPAHVLNASLLRELHSRLNDVEEDPYVRAIILTGSGRFFCAGADISELSHVTTAHGGSEFSAQGQTLLNRLERLDKPVIAAINGVCLGGGLELAMACHIRLAAESAILGLPETKLGLIPGFGGTQRLPRIIGPSRAVEMILTGSHVTAAEAERIGLVSRVLTDEGLMAEAEAVAGAIIARSAGAVQAALHAVRGGLDIPLAEGLARESELFGRLCTGEDAKEAFQAFREKRQPNFARTDA